MQPYCNLKNAHKDFFLHMYEDIKHYLLCNSNKTYQDVIEYIKKKNGELQKHKFNNEG